MNSIKTNPFVTLLKNLIALIIVYYVSLLLHEWGHGFVAWLFGVKTSPFDVHRTKKYNRFRKSIRYRKVVQNYSLL